MISDSSAPKKLAHNEEVKKASQFLRGTLLKSMEDPVTGSIPDDDAGLTKFHGLYLQDDRDLRQDRRKRKLEKAFCFMIRIRVPGGVATPEQYLMIDDLAQRYANGTIRLTTRQAFQFHGLLKGNVKPVIQHLDKVCMDSLAACGDVNRNVMCNTLPEKSAVHREVYETSCAISHHLTPRTRAYHEIWLDEKPVAGGDEEPIYGETYLPRKFKIGITVPPDNDVDVFSQDLGYIAVVEKGKLVGFNVVVGGGMGRTHGNAKTYARLADVLGFCTPDQAVAVAEAVVKAQRDHGDRSDRKHARLKYTIDDHGLDWFRQEVEKHLGWKLEKGREVALTHNSDRYGWQKDAEGLWYFTPFILSGRIKDTDEAKYLTGLREIAKIHQGDFRLTPNQNIMIGRVSEEEKPRIQALLEEYKLAQTHEGSGLRLNAMACVALPTCGLALSESERFLPRMIERLETELEKVGLQDDEISLRITGCPNGCARPYLAEIGLVGKVPGKYNLYLGAKHDGSRLNEEYGSSLTEDEIVETLKPIFRSYVEEREQGERFGDFCVRQGLITPR
ncbi:MAG: NADPH-dependent assimilatory sulfite reductase hemoprotein subunit [Opitutales bacterium]|nr:NADPH-dependent assimilatory sulfite reductase hemoprotein subunit [Opitutales bacterium]